GIRDFHVTGVQTCALPILLHLQALPEDELASAEIEADEVIDALMHLVLPQSDLVVVDQTLLEQWRADGYLPSDTDAYQSILRLRSEERRVGKSIDVLRQRH